MDRMAWNEFYCLIIQVKRVYVDNCWGPTDFTSLLTPTLVKIGLLEIGCKVCRPRLYADFTSYTLSPNNLIWSANKQQQRDDDRIHPFETSGLSFASSSSLRPHVFLVLQVIQVIHNSIPLVIHNCIPLVVQFFPVNNKNIWVF
ncbi:hypothetical protein BDA99DRAFT_539030 [Phascolomyces articulosus]|uniref:Uncharacterized protein n=1 Tax=Phascolomyces articulosus TaxID=60185 RepID=A0AAD5JWH2_9FUNG|nr:hypothetical protein BDA99DRAFT_539030 [Phascolomyces articulosus]